ncbi:MAG: response regulator [bacterium]|nr:response regulator [bacterium]
MNSVLVIDDEKTLSNMIGMVLKRNGYTVETASCGNEGIQKFDANLHDYVITDIRMPDGDGMTVLQHIRRSRKPSTPVIGMSGTPWLLKEDSFDAALTKPFTIHKLFNTIERLSPRPEKSLDELIAGVQKMSAIGDN